MFGVVCRSYPYALNRSARSLALTGLRARFPDATEAELHFKLAVLLLGEEIAGKVDMQRLEDQLLEEGIKKFADPQKALLELIDEKRAALAS